MRRLHLLLAFVLLVGCKPVATTDPQGEEPTANNNAVLIDWEVKQLEPGEFDEPNYSLALTLSRGSPRSVSLNSYVGSFADGRDSPVVQVNGAILTGASWWAGAGDEFYVSRATDGNLEIWHRVVEEGEDAPAEFTLLKTVGIPPEITVEAGDNGGGGAEVTP